MYELAYKLRGKGLGRIPGVQSIYKMLIPREETLKKVKVLDFEMLVDLRDIGDLTSSLVTRGAYDECMTTVINKEVKFGMNCIDIGANIGYFTLLLSKLVGESGSVLAYEPELRNSVLLGRNLTLNKVTNTHTVLGGIADKAGTLTLYTSKTFFGSHSLRRGISKGKIDTESVDIDTLDNQVGNKRVDFIKVDVQGAEHMVLQGMERILAGNYNLVMVWEYLPDGLKRFDCSPFTFLNNLKSKGFCFEDIDERLGLMPITIAGLLNKYNKKGSHTNILVRR